MTTGYCVRCKKNVEMVNAEEAVFKSGVRAMKGKCSKCGTMVCRIIGK